MIEITASYLASQGLSETFPKRFWSKVKKTDGCWIWTASKDKRGYGKISSSGKPGKWITSSRGSWILNVGPILDGLWVLHRCPGGSNPSCVNPDHLYLGTCQDNNRDTVREGRHRGGASPGQANHLAKLDWKKVKTIRSMYASGKFSLKQLGEIFGVWENSIWMVTQRITWKDSNLPNKAHNFPEGEPCKSA